MMVIGTLVCLFVLFMLVYFAVLMAGETMRAARLHWNTRRINHQYAHSHPQRYV